MCTNTLWILISELFLTIVEKNPRHVKSSQPNYEVTVLNILILFFLKARIWYIKDETRNQFTGSMNVTQTSSFIADNLKRLILVIHALHINSVYDLRQLQPIILIRLIFTKSFYMNSINVFCTFITFSNIREKVASVELQSLNQLQLRLLSMLWRVIFLKKFWKKGKYLRNKVEKLRRWSHLTNVFQCHVFWAKMARGILKNQLRYSFSRILWKI